MALMVNLRHLEAHSIHLEGELSVAELDLVTAMTTYAKSKVELDRATGATLEHNGVLIQDAVTGKVSTSSP